MVWKEKSRDFIKKHFLKSYSKYFIGFSRSLKFLLLKRKKYLIFNLIVTYIKWIIVFLSVYFIFLAFNFNISFYPIVIFFSFIMIITLIPVSILGVTEISGTYLLTLVDVPKVIGANVLITLTFLGYLLNLIYYIINHKLLEKSQFFR